MVERHVGTAPRRSEFIEHDGEVDDEALIPQEDMVVTVSHAGYIKRVPLSTYRLNGAVARALGHGDQGRGFCHPHFCRQHPPAGAVFLDHWHGLQNESLEVALGSPQSRGKALVNLLPLDSGEGIADIMALPEDETQWAALNVMFATSFGNIRRNELSDFVQINRGGKIAMKPDEDERIIGVETCGGDDDVLLTTSDGRAIRFPVEAVRVFRSRNSTGVRGIKLAEGAEVISLAILRHSDATPAERNTYLRQAAAIRRAAAEEGEAEVEEIAADDEGGEETTALSAERYAELGAPSSLF